jgi:hypothetical protein
MKISATLNEQAMAQLVLAGPLRSAEEVAEFLDADAEERADIIENYRLARLANTKSAWDGFIAVAGVVLSVAGVASAIASAVTGVYAVTQL